MININNSSFNNILKLNENYSLFQDCLLGSGAFGKIYKCQNQKTNQIFAREGANGAVLSTTNNTSGNEHIIRFIVYFKPKQNHALSFLTQFS